MLKRGIVISAVFAFVFSSICNAFYYNADEDVALTPLGGGWIGAGSLFTMNFEITNIGLEDLPDLGFTTQFIWNDIEALTYNNATHTWVGNTDWVMVYGVQSQDDLLSMDRGGTDVPLIWDQNGTKPLATLTADDSVSVLWLGDLGVGETIQFTWYTQCSDRFDLDVTGFFVSTVPEPVSIALLGLGTGFLLWRRK